jgi:acetyltransferase-like isoleucine patch superfamily enzyme
VRNFYSKIISRLPGNNLRILLYRKLLGYTIGKGVRIGKTFIKCNEVDIGDNVVIGSNNVIVCDTLLIGKNSKIISGNKIIGKSSLMMGGFQNYQ